MGSGHMGNGHMGNGHMGTLFLKIVLQTNMQPASIAFAAGGRSIDPLAAQQVLPLQSVGPGTMPSPSRKKRRTVSAPRQADAQVVPVAEHAGEMYALLQMRSLQHRTNAGKASLIGGHKDSSDTS